AGNGSQVDAVLFSQLARGRGGNRVVFASVGGSGSRGSSGRGGSWSSSGSTAFNDRTQYFVGQDGVALALDDVAQHAVSGGQYFQDDLVSLDVDDQLVTLDGV